MGIRRAMPFLRALYVTCVAAVAAISLAMAMAASCRSFGDLYLNWPAVPALSRTRDVVLLTWGLFLPSGIVAVAAICSFRSRTPAAAGIVAGFGRVATPIVAVLLLTYTGMVLRLLPFEAAGRNAVLAAQEDPRGLALPADDASAWLQFALPVAAPNAGSAPRDQVRTTAFARAPHVAPRAR
jgi:hypothetical protein